jgi:hypothetical protein
MAIPRRREQDEYSREEGGKYRCHTHKAGALGVTVCPTVHNCVAPAPSVYVPVYLCLKVETEPSAWG